MRKSHGALQDTNDFPDSVTRHFGGKQRSNQYYFPGHFHVILQPPDKIFNGDGNISAAAGQSIDTITKDDSSNALAFERWIAGTCKAFTPHGRTPGFEEMTGLGGLKSGYLTGSNEVTNEFSLTLNEVAGMPVFQALDLWTSYSDPHHGVTSVDGDQVVPSSYKGDCFVLLTKPSFSGEKRELLERDIEQLFYYDGVFPKNVPLDALAQDLQTHSPIEYSIQFNFDGFPIDKSDVAVLERGLEEFNNRFSLDAHHNKHYGPNGPVYLDNSSKMAVTGSRGGYKNQGRGTW